jgi:hypothetical protein
MLNPRTTQYLVSVLPGVFLPEELVPLVGGVGDGDERGSEGLRAPGLFNRGSTSTAEVADAARGADPCAGARGRAHEAGESSAAERKAVRTELRGRITSGLGFGCCCELDCQTHPGTE